MEFPFSIWLAWCLVVLFFSALFAWNELTLYRQGRLVNARVKQFAEFFKIKKYADIQLPTRAKEQRRAHRHTF